MALSRTQKMRNAARKRHATFKRTKVQTHGGTRKNYSAKEAKKIEAAMGKGSFSSVTGGAKNPLNRAPSTEGVKVGEMKPEFTSSLTGTDYSKFAGAMNANPFAPGASTGPSFSDSLRMSGARFNEVGRNDLAGGTKTAGIFDFLSKPAIPNAAEKGKEYLDGVRDTNAADDTKLLQNLFKRIKINNELGDQSYNSIGDGTLTATNYNDLSPGLQSILQNQLKSFERQGKGAGELQRLQKMYPGFTKADAGMDMSGMFASTDLAGSNIQPVASSYDPGSTRFAVESGNFDPDAYQANAGGLNLSQGYGGVDQETSSRIGRALAAGPSPRMLSEGGDLRFSDMFNAATPGATLTKGINTVKNKIPLLNRIPDMKMNSVAEEAQRQYLGYNPNLPASALARMDRRGGSGTRTAAAPTVAQQVSPETQPVPSTSTTSATQTGVDPNRLLQIQQQAYQQAYNPMSIGGFNPQFRFASRAPSIDYSTYFNYS